MDSLFKGTLNASVVSSGFSTSSAPGCSRLAVAAHADPEANIDKGNTFNPSSLSAARADEGKAAVGSEDFAPESCKAELCSTDAGGGAGVKDCQEGQAYPAEACGNGLEPTVCRGQEVRELLHFGDKAFLLGDWEGATCLYQRCLPLASAHIVVVSMAKAQLTIVL
jgi:hypothetical protein